MYGTGFEGYEGSFFSRMIAGGNLAVALEWLLDHARRTPAPDEASPPISPLARYCDELAQAHVDRSSTVKHVGMAGPGNLYLVTNPLLAGDQIDYLRQVVKARPFERHVVLLTGVPDADRLAATREVRAIGAFPICPAPGLTAHDRLLWLQAKVQSLVAQRVFLLCNTDDVLALVAASCLAPHYGRRLYALELGVNEDGEVPAAVPTLANATVLPDRFSRLAALIQRTELGAGLAPDLQSPESIRTLFDEGFYLWANPQVAEAGIDPLVHYLEEGMEKGCKPHPLFEQDYYLSQLPPDLVSAAKCAPLAHYLHYGERLGYRPHPLFDPTWCRVMLRAKGHWPEADNVRVSALARYCAVGGLVSPHPLFDPMHYARQLPLQMEGAALLIHLLEQGLPEGLSPHPLINVERLDAGRKNFRLSFLTYICQQYPTWDEPSPHVLFDPKYFAEGDPARYAAAAPNLLWAYMIEGNVPEHSPHPLISVDHVARGQQAVYSMAETVLDGIVTGHVTADTHPLVSGDHIRSQGTWSWSGGMHPTLYYVLHWAAQQIDPHPWFSTQYYISQNHDVAASGQNPLLHYLSVGEAEDRQPIPFFSTRHYRTVAPITVKPGGLLVDYVERGAGLFELVQPLETAWAFILRKSAKRSFEAGDHRGSVAYLRESLQSEWAPSHPTLITEVRNLDIRGDIGAEVYSMRKVTVARPSIVSQYPIHAPSGTYDAPAASVAVYESALVVGANDGFVTKDGVWCDHGLVGFNPDKMTIKDGAAAVSAHHDHVLLRRYGSEHSVRSAILGIGAYAKNYFHFMFETLPRALLAADQAPAGTPVLVNDGMPVQHYQALRLMLPNNPLIRLGSHFTYKVHELYAASMPSLVHDAFGDATAPTDSVRYHPDVLARLARFAEPFRIGAARRKLFLRRVGAIRNLLNIDELERELVGLGFESVSCEQLSFADQVRLFATAEAIVAPTGAHLTNIVFAPSDARIFPLYSNAPGNNYYLWSVMGDLLGQQVSNVAGMRVAGSCAGRAPEAHEDYSVQPALITPFFVRPDINRRQFETNGKLVISKILDHLDAANSESTSVVSAWGLIAGKTPVDFENRLRMTRRLALSAIIETRGVELSDIAAHRLFSSPYRDLRSGLVLLREYDDSEATVIRSVDVDFTKWSESPAVTSEDRLDRLRQVLVAILYLQPWQLPLLRDLNDLPVEARPLYLNWLKQSPLLCRAGDESAYADFVIRLLDWLQYHISSERPLSQLLEIGRTIGSLDLGKLLLIEQPLRSIQERRNRLLERLALRDGIPRTKVRSNDGSEGKIRIGILCRTFEKGPDSEAVVAFFRAFDKARYDIRAYSIGLRDRVVANDPAFNRILRETFSQTTSVSSDAATLREHLIADELDVFLFANATTYGLRDLDKALFHRVAPVQAELNSHMPMPLGYPSFDAFITGQVKDDDQDVAQDDYVETLVRQKGPATNYLTSLEPRADMGLTRASFGLAEDDVVAMSAGSLAKLGHNCLATMMRAVREIPNGRLLLAPYNPGWAGLTLAIPFNQQIAETAEDVGLPLERITVLGELTVAETEAALSLSDIYLNPFPHGGATMTHLALIYAKPPITLLRQSTRSIDQFLLNALGFDELVAATTDDYVALAKKLGANTSLRQDCAKRLAAANRSVLVGNMNYSRDMKETVERLIAKVAQPMSVQKIDGES